MTSISKSREPRPIYQRHKVSDTAWSDWYPIASRTTERITYSNSRKDRRGRYRDFNPCVHYKTLGTHSLVTAPGGSLQYRDGTNLDWLPIESIRAHGLAQAHISLDFIKDNQFELIPFLMEWDETIAMFSKKFLKELSYGSFTWGILPFVSDLKSLFNSLQAINDKILRSYEKIVAKRITRRFSWETKFSGYPYFDHYCVGVTTISGTLSGDFMFPNNVYDALLIFLDELGINPDAKTVWDLIPFSFVVDYFLPVGDLLESVHPRGWFNPTFIFDGGYSVDVDVQERYSYGYTGGGLDYSVFIRGKLDSYVLPARPPVEPEYSSPSLRELFNTVYLLKGSVSRS